MLAEKPYNREHANEYAQRWALDRNPLFYNFTGIGGDCTNFISQCLYAGSCVMNYSQTNGWYYSSTNSRAPSWTGVSYFYDFLTKNKGVGPYARETYPGGLTIGDVIQLGNSDGTFYHTLLVTGFEDDTYLIAAHTDDSLNRRLDTYIYAKIRFLHIEGVRFETGKNQDCFYNVYQGISL